MSRFAKAVIYASSLHRGGMRRVPTLLLTLLLCATAGGCQSDAASEEGRTPIRVFLLLINQQQTQYYQWAEETYEARHPDVNIIFEQFPGTSLKDYEIKLRLRFRSRQAPDIFQYREMGLVEFAHRGLLAPAPDYIEEIVQENSLNELVRRAPYFDGVCYGVVHDASWTALYYNKEMFREAGLDPEQPPRTWRELLNYAERLTKYRPDGSIRRSGLSLRKTGYKPGIAEKWLTFFYSAGGTDFNEAGTEAYFDSEAGRAAMGLYQEVLFEEHIDVAGLESDMQAFGQERTAMFIREIHAVSWLREHHPDLEFDVAPIPALTTSESGGGAYPMVVSNDSEHKEAAWRFIEFLMGDEVYARYVRMGETLPCTRSVATLPEFQNDSYLPVFLKQPVHPPPKVPKATRALSILGGYIERFCYGHMSAQEALEEANRQVNALLARNKPS